jgi:hypothetical protein
LRGSSPTSIVVTTVFVEASMTVTSSESAFAT